MFSTVSSLNMKSMTNNKYKLFTFQVNGLKERLAVLNDMDEKLKRLNEFNGQLKEYDGKLKEAEQWLGGGRKRMDELIKPEKPIHQFNSDAGLCI